MRRHSTKISDILMSTTYLHLYFDRIERFCDVPEDVTKSHMCFVKNFWLYYQSTDGVLRLQRSVKYGWVENTLRKL